MKSKCVYVEVKVLKECDMADRLKTLVSIESPITNDRLLQWTIDLKLTIVKIDVILKRIKQYSSKKQK